MSEQKLKVGDVVQLKSGGPRMTIQAIDSNGMAEVSFYTSTNGLDTKTFPVEALQLCKGNGSVHSRILGG